MQLLLKTMFCFVDGESRRVRPCRQSTTNTDGFELPIAGCPGDLTALDDSQI